jgi:hypothetical protein
MDKWHILYNGQKKSATTETIIKGLIIEKLLPDTLVWKAGMAEWVKIRNCEAFAETLLNIPPPLPKEENFSIPQPAEEVTAPLDNLGQPLIAATENEAPTLGKVPENKSSEVGDETTEANNPENKINGVSSAHEERPFPVEITPATVAPPSGGNHTKSANSESKQLNVKQLGTAWLTFYKYVSLPLGALIGLLVGFSLVFEPVQYTSTVILEQPIDEHHAKLIRASQTEKFKNDPGSPAKLSVLQGLERYRKLTSFQPPINPAQQPNRTIKGLIILFLSIFQGGVAIGLIQRKLWGWQSNWLLLVLGCFSMAYWKAESDIAKYAIRHNITGQTVITDNMAYDVGVEYIAVFIITFILFTLFYFLPNYIYFTKRKDLFTE